jgi:hypothetical protein
MSLFLLFMALHNFHVSYGKIAIEGQSAICQIRFFKDDLANALKKHHALSDFELAVTPRVDSLYLAYFNQCVELNVNGKKLKPTILSSGEDQDMWSYRMEFKSDKPIQGTVMIRNALLFDLFDDQKNICQIALFPSEDQKSFYFTPSEEKFTFETP